jgi:phenylacetate-CoA ligase
MEVWEDVHRLPDLDEGGKNILLKILQHPQAPVFHNRSGHFLTKARQQELFLLEQEEIQRHCSPPKNTKNDLSKFLDLCRKQVPFYRDYNWSFRGDHLQASVFSQLPCISREDLSRDITRFVPDHLSLDNLLAFTTNGTTGHAIVIPSHPEIAARYSWFHKKALLWNRVDPENFQSDVAVMLAGFQKKCFTYASLIHSLNNKGLIKTNFYPDDWKNPDDRKIYVEAMAPDLITGDPLSLHELTQLNIQHKPQAIISTSMALLKQQQQSLEDYWQCPVINIYSMNEAGPIATSVKGIEGFRLLQSNMLVEILDADGNLLPAGERGEITITQGINDYLPLLRYRTGDYAKLEQKNDGFWYLMDLEGRPPVKYQTTNGEWLNNVDITHALNEFALPQFTLHQFKSGDVEMRVRGDFDTTVLCAKLKEIFGNSVQISIHTHQQFVDKVIQYSRE